MSSQSRLVPLRRRLRNTIARDRLARPGERVLRDGAQVALPAAHPAERERRQRGRPVRHRFEIRGQGNIILYIVVLPRLIRAIRQELEEHCLRFAVHHLTAVVRSEAFARLDEATLKQFIAKVADMGAFRY